MVLGGLWHGASWNFVLWGALHGAALAVTRVWQRGRTGDVGDGHAGEGGVARVFSVVATFHFVCLAWVFFRAPTFGHAILALDRLGRGSWHLDHVAPKVVLVLGAAALLHALPARWESRARERFARSPAVAQGLLLAGAAMALHLAAAAAPEPFVYGQF
jgi:hypothetical protein